jgi:hypothetical protein
MIDALASVPEGRALMGAICASGKQCGWVKVKCATWREANKEWWRLLERHR